MPKKFFQNVFGTIQTASAKLKFKIFCHYLKKTVVEEGYEEKNSTKRPVFSEFQAVAVDLFSVKKNNSWFLVCVRTA